MHPVGGVNGGGVRVGETARMAGGRRARRSAAAVPAPLRRALDLLGPTTGAAGQTLGALGLNSITSFVAGAIMVALIPTFREVPGLLVLMTPAIGLCGNVFTTFGNRLSTAIHIGTYSPSLRGRGVMGQNLRAAFTLVGAMSVALAVLARLLASVIGQPTVALPELVAIAVVGGLLGAVPNVLLAVALTRGAVRRGWDLDNLVAPVVSTFGDVLTIPALWLAAVAVRRAGVADAVCAVAVVVTAIAVVLSLRSPHPELRRIVVESGPILVAALVLDTLGGLVLQHQLNALAVLPAVFVLIPAFVSSGGALGGILCGRVSTALHLGNLRPTGLPGRAARRDVAFLAALAVPVFALNGVGAVLFAPLSGSGGDPGWGWTTAVSLIAGAITMVAVVAISWWTTVGAFRVGVDPDSAGVPIMSAAIDVIGAATVIAVVFALGLH